MTDPVLAVRDLEKHYPVTGGLLGRRTGAVRAVDGVSFDVRRGETLGLVGESGCGKSTVAETALGLQEPTGGEVRFGGTPVDDLAGDAAREFHRRTSMVFQDPTGAFDPRMTVGESVAEPLRIHGVHDPAERRAVVADAVDRVGLNPGDVDRYPHEFSGGQKQRLALARALVSNPDLLVLDEPVSALDVSVQAAVLSLLEDLKERFDLSVLLISHDMSVVRQVCDRVAVMYLGELVEVAPTDELFADPRHPYTRALLDSVPVPDPTRRDEGAPLPGDVPDPQDPPAGCRFHTRCPELIPPEGSDLDLETVRAGLALRRALDRGDLSAGDLRDRAVAEGIAPSRADAAADDLDRVVRDAHDLPERLPDEAAASALADALSELAAGDETAAAERLADAFATPCEASNPDLRDVGEGRTAACHLHEEARTAARPASRADGGRSDAAGDDGAADERS